MRPSRCFHDAPRVKSNARLLGALRDCDAHCGLRERGVRGFEPAWYTPPVDLADLVDLACVAYVVLADGVPLPLRVAVACGFAHIWTGKIK